MILDATSWPYSFDLFFPLPGSGLEAVRVGNAMTPMVSISEFGAMCEKRSIIPKKGRVVREKNLGILDMFFLHEIVVKVVQKLKELSVVGSGISKSWIVGKAVISRS